MVFFKNITYPAKLLKENALKSAGFRPLKKGIKNLWNWRDEMIEKNLFFSYKFDKLWVLYSLKYLFKFFTKIF